MRFTYLFIKEKAFSRLGVCFFFGFIVWLAALGYQTQLMPFLQQKAIQEKTEGAVPLPAKKPAKIEKKRFPKDMVSNDEALAL